MTVTDSSLQIQAVQTAKVAAGLQAQLVVVGVRQYFQRQVVHQQDPREYHLALADCATAPAILTTGAEKMDWVMSGGGPLIVLPIEHLPAWRGDNPTTAGSTNDYDRACRIKDYLGVLKVGMGSGLILGDEPMQTSFLRRADGGILIRWGHAENEDDVRDAVCGAPETIWSPTEHRLKVGRARVIIFDSAYAGDDLPSYQGPDVLPVLDVALATGDYRIETADYKPDENTWLILHRLSRIVC
jgi:hypothetical protein